MVLKGGGRGPTKIGVVPLSDARSERSAGTRLVALDYVWSGDTSVFSGVMNAPMVHAQLSSRLGRKNGGHFTRRAGNAGWSCWRRLRLCTPGSVPPSAEAPINLEYYRFNYQLSNEIHFSGLVSVLDAEVGLLRK